jgi:heat-inducible transcriptional repressor
MGFLEKPHVSAGRVPSYQAYRLYVNELMERYRIASEEMRQIRENLRLKMQELDNILLSASKVVSELTQQTSISMLTGRSKQIVKRVEIIPVDEGYSYAVVLVSDNEVKSHMLRLTEPVSPSNAAILSSAVNMAIGEHQLEYLLPRVAMSTGQESPMYYFASRVIEYVDAMENAAAESEVYVQGTSHLLDNREYQDTQRFKELLDYFSDRSKLRALASTADPNRVNILIGPEINEPLLRDASFVFTTYDVGHNAQGIIGVIAPTRMDYARACAKLAAFAQSLRRDGDELELKDSDNGELT